MTSGLQQTLLGTLIEDWDFAKADTSYLLHGIHPYPARMIPQIAKRLIDRYSKEGDVILDPFCGSGTVLLESFLTNRRSFGFDINPLAYNISLAKTTLIELKTLDELNELISEQIRIKKKEKPMINPIELDTLNVGLWFKPSVMNDLKIITDSIKQIVTEQNCIPYFKILFSATIYETANIDKEDNPYFIRTLKEEKLRKFNPDAIKIFLAKTRLFRARMKATLEYAKRKNLSSDYRPKLFLGDCRDNISSINPFSLVVTSPPYGEEKNTMSYMRFAKLACYWFGYTQEQLSELNKLSLGFNGKEIVREGMPSNELVGLLENLEKQGHQERAKEVYNFFKDYYEVLLQIKENLKDSGYCCIVIGNRTAKGIPVKNDVITRELLEYLGLKHIATYSRGIPKKVLPRNDGKVELINKESILVMKK